jgi:formiminotetrahydrofolate cyclodeaminase
VKQATAVPIRTIELCNRILTTLETMLGKTNKMLDSDLVTASILAKSSAEIAAVTARINLPLISDHERTSELEKTIQSLIASCETIARSIDEACGAV